MAANIINISDKEFVLLANKLEKIGKADLPVAVRSTLNSLAFDMKGTSGKRGQIEKRAEKDFDYKRNKTLFRAMTGVDKASGLSISRMESEAGIINRSGKNELAEGLADQQKGGKTDQKATPLKKARISKALSKKIRKPAYLQKLPARDLRNKKGQRFHQGAISAYKGRSMIIANGRGGTKLLGRIKSFKRRKGTVKYRIDWLYRFNQGGQVTLKRKRPFVNRAAEEVMKGMPKEFVNQANKRITKSLKK